ncbi:MAG: efflux transporter outer membrane subunit [Deltaproteobacteria bacterium]|nr:efflux transporter outer membrane subunit [Deltaproteobacteria bacterium]MBW2013010.1 efflux transporter outer membrane subunit [Deltaproteobacteria bacterium]MBW2087956.1 efflux transporter outer membrane subunit [Deltaproteobacteria bacterium]
MKNFVKVFGPKRLAVILLLVASCSPFKPQARQSPAGELPRTFSLYTAESEPLSRWWEVFNDPDLNALITQALTDNLTIKEAWSRLNQARALAVQAGAALYPDLTGTGRASFTRERTGNGSRKTLSNQDHSLGIISSYELDLWGRIRSGRESALLEVTASREDLNTVAMTLAAEVANRWINIISQRMQKRLLESQLQANLTYLELIELRFRKAMVSALDVYQQKQIVDDVRAEIPLVEAQEQLLRHELALLLGKPPQTVLNISREDLPEPVGIPATGLPSDLLSARPDLRAAGMRLWAAEWQVAAARANRLPAISLTGQARYGDGDLDVLFDNWLLSLAGNLTAPIFDGRRRAAEVDRSLAVVDENLAAYRQTVLTAIKEVEDALISESKRQEHIKGLEKVLDTARKALKQAGNRYRNGLTDYLPVLTQLLTVQGLERDLIQQQTNLVGARISLYRALGGTWTDSLTP